MCEGCGQGERPGEEQARFRREHRSQPDSAERAEVQRRVNLCTRCGQRDLSKAWACKIKTTKELLAMLRGEAPVCPESGTMPSREPTGTTPEGQGQ